MLVLQKIGKMVLVGKNGHWLHSFQLIIHSILESKNNVNLIIVGNLNVCF